MEVDHNHGTISPMMRVFDSSGRFIGTVRAVGEHSIAICPLYGTRPIKISLASVASSLGNEVRLGTIRGAVGARVS